MHEYQHLITFLSASLLDSQVALAQWKKVESLQLNQQDPDFWNETNVILFYPELYSSPSLMLAYHTLLKFLEEYQVYYTSRYYQGLYPYILIDTETLKRIANEKREQLVRSCYQIKDKLPPFSIPMGFNYQQKARNALLKRNNLPCTIENTADPTHDYSFDFFEERNLQGTYFLRGKPLAYYLQKYQFSLVCRLNLAIKCCLAVAKLHCNRLIYASVSPHNLLLIKEKTEITFKDYKETLQLGPLQRHIHVNRTSNLNDYCAPEMYENTLFFATDVFALGRVFLKDFRFYEDPVLEDITQKMLIANPEQRLGLCAVILSFCAVLVGLPEKGSEELQLIAQAHAWLHQTFFVPAYGVTFNTNQSSGIANKNFLKLTEFFQRIQIQQESLARNGIDNKLNLYLQREELADIYNYLFRHQQQFFSLLSTRPALRIEKNDSLKRSFNIIQDLNGDFILILETKSKSISGKYPAPIFSGKLARGKPSWRIDTSPQEWVSMVAVARGFSNLLKVVKEVKISQRLGKMASELEEHPIHYRLLGAVYCRPIKNASDIIVLKQTTYAPRALGSLEWLIKTQQIPPEIKLNIAQSIIGAVILMHDPHINRVHQDIKPANILIYENQGRLSAKLTNFDLCKRSGSLATLQTTSGYESPEIAQVALQYFPQWGEEFRNENSYGFRCMEQIPFRQEYLAIHCSNDMWSMGVTLYQLFVNQINQPHFYHMVYLAQQNLLLSLLNPLREKRATAEQAMKLLQDYREEKQKTALPVEHSTMVSLDLLVECPFRTLVFTQRHTPQTSDTTPALQNEMQLVASGRYRFQS